MRFAVIGTNYQLSSPPCEGAVWETYVRIEEYLCHYPEPTPNWWCMNGYNHRADGDCLKRDITDYHWFIYIDMIEELEIFVRKHSPFGVISIGPFACNPIIMAIQIGQGREGMVD